MTEPFRKLTARTLVLSEHNIDTDQIIPARFLTTTTREGLGRHAFHDWRWNADGSEKPNSRLPPDGAGETTILVAGDNFGCGSSREHAAWALADYGFRVVLSSSLADIFRGNALKNGVVAVAVPPELHERLLAQPGLRITVDLENCTVAAGNDEPVAFEIEPFARACLLEGVDQLGFLLARGEVIAAYEERLSAHADQA
jgi:3-isopropylmalate/(R)-2-methylmalate dehydratase small subunit